MNFTTILIRLKLTYDDSWKILNNVLVFAHV